MGKSNHISPLELESLSFTRGDNESASQQQQQQQQSFEPLLLLQNVFALIAAYASYYSNITIPIAAICLVVVVIVALDFIASASTHRHVAMVKHDYTEAHSEFELKMQLIDHWCLSGGDDDCTCDDPTMAMSNEQTKGWVKAHKYNKLLLEPASNLASIDVVMIGDQTMEEWNARWLGTPNDEFKEANAYFDKSFKRASGGQLEGIALGVAWDSISNLLWRLQHGEMPNGLNPRVWWILIGANDLGIGQCSEEAVVLGILRLAEFIATQKPGSKIVINSILPALTTVKPRVKSAHFKEFDLFPSIRVVNEQLEMFCKKHPNFAFYDANPLFSEGSVPSSTDKSKKRKYVPSLKSSLIHDNGQLTGAGHKVWADAIVLEVKKLMYDDSYEDGYSGDMSDDMYPGDDIPN